jgi:hypothetical protein
MIEFEGQILQKDQMREAKKYKALLAEREAEIAVLKDRIQNLLDMIDRDLTKKK